MMFKKLQKVNDDIRSGGKGHIPWYRFAIQFVSQVTDFFSGGVSIPLLLITSIVLSLYQRFHFIVNQKKTKFQSEEFKIEMFTFTSHPFQLKKKFQPH